MTSNDSVEIHDCRGKELMMVSRYSGDLVVNFFDEDGENEFVVWFKLKRPQKRYFEEILALFREIKEKLVQPTME